MFQDIILSDSLQYSLLFQFAMSQSLLILFYVQYSLVLWTIIV
jgi:hypothetical protein